MKATIRFFLIYLLTGMVTYFGYRLVYNSSFDLGLFCDVSTDCYEMAQKSIIFNWILLFILIVAGRLILKKKYQYLMVVVLVLFFNIIKLGSAVAMLLLFIVNIFVLLFSAFLIEQESIWHRIIACIGIILIYFLELFYISELFYYNPRFEALENVMYIVLTFFSLCTLLLSFLKRKTHRVIQPLH